MYLRLSAALILAATLAYYAVLAWYPSALAFRLGGWPLPVLLAVALIALFAALAVWLGLRDDDKGAPR